MRKGDLKFSVGQISIPAQNQKMSGKTDSVSETTLIWIPYSELWKQETSRYH